MMLAASGRKSLYPFRFYTPYTKSIVHPLIGFVFGLLKLIRIEPSYIYAGIKATLQPCLLYGPILHASVHGRSSLLSMLENSCTILAMM